MSDGTETSNQMVASSLPVTAIIFAVISAVLYFWLLKPLLSPVPPREQGNRAAGDQTPVRVAHNNGQRRARQAARSSGGGDSSDIATLLAENTQCPPYMNPESARYLDTGGISLLSDGVLPFRHGRAAAYEQALAKTDSNVVAKNRKDRARLLARVLALDDAGLTSPPSRGSTVVISIPSTDVGCEKLRRALYLLSTHFNTMVILSNVDKDTTDKDVDALVDKLRGDNPTDLPTDVLPRHRIVAAQSITGRVAFVRQLGRVEFVLDSEEEMRSQLGRFGFRVLVYGNDSKDGSALGNSLIA
jgi:hypothetical protein